MSADQAGSDGVHPCGLPELEELAQDQDHYDANSLAQVITSRLFSAGLDMYFALMVVRDGPAVTRLEHAVTELDEAIKDLRHMMLAFWDQAGGLPEQAANPPGPGHVGVVGGPRRRGRD